MRSLVSVSILLLLVLCIGVVSAEPIGTLWNNITYTPIDTYDGSDQLTHPSVVYSADGWNGYNYLMAFTPYPGGNDTYENPSMVYSNDKVTWVKLAGQPDPIISYNGVYHNADTHIVLNGSTLYLFYRTGTAAADAWINYTTTTDGVTWTTPIQTNLLDINSPSFYYNGTGWEAWGHPNAGTYNLTHYYSTNLTHWLSGTTTDINMGAKTTWHSEVKYYDGQFQAMLVPTDYTGLYFYNSSNGVNWTASELNPILTSAPGRWDQQLYKSSFIDNEDGTFDIWYTGWTTAPVWRVGYTRYDPAIYRLRIYSETDGRAGRASVNEDWTTIIAGAGNTASTSGSVTDQIQASSTSNRYQNNYRAIVIYNTSTIPDNATILRSEIGLYKSSAGGANLGTAYHGIVAMQSRLKHYDSECRLWKY